MSDVQDIRAWARENGWDVGTKGRLAQEIHDAYAQQANGQPQVSGDGEDDGPVIPLSLDAPPPAAPGAAGGPAAPPQPPGAGAAPTLNGERPPKPPPGQRRRKLADRVKRARDNGPRPGHKRVSIENLVSSGWAMGAMALARSPRALPVARVLDMQAPVAGIIVEDMAKGTLVDKLLQPLARGGEKAEKAFALAGPPLLVGLMNANPQLFPVLKPMLKMSLMSWMQIAGPAMAKVQKRQEQFSEEFAGIDLDAIIDGLWVGIPDAGPLSPDEEDAIRRARGDS